MIAARAFDPFFTTKPLGAGTGLCLSMVYGFARQSGGLIRIYFEVGRGTTMRLYLPRHRAGEGESAVEEESIVEAPSVTGKTVLVVDDEPTVRMLVSEVILEEGYAVLEAIDGATALKMLQSDVRIDLLITDVGLPRRQQQASGRRCGARASARIEDPLHHRLRRECRDRQRIPRRWHERADEALHGRRAGAAHPRTRE